MPSTGCVEESSRRTSRRSRPSRTTTRPVERKVSPRPSSPRPRRRHRPRHRVAPPDDDGLVARQPSAEGLRRAPARVECREEGDEVTWRRCTSRIFCTEERVTVPHEDLLSTRAGRPGRPHRDGRTRARRGRAPRTEGAPICPSHSEGALAAMTSPLLTPKTRSGDPLTEVLRTSRKDQPAWVTLPGPLAKRQCRPVHHLGRAGPPIHG